VPAGERAEGRADAQAEVNGVGGMLVSRYEIHDLDPSKESHLLNNPIVAEYIQMIGKNIGVDPVEEAYFRHRVGREQYSFAQVRQ